MGAPGDCERAHPLPSTSRSGFVMFRAPCRGCRLPLLYFLMLLVLAHRCMGQAVTETACKYFGRASTGRVDRLVRDACPLASRGGVYYFTVDVLPGQCPTPSPYPTRDTERCWSQPTLG
jgi:hypothetical protein